MAIRIYHDRVTHACQQRKIMHRVREGPAILSIPLLLRHQLLHSMGLLQTMRNWRSEQPCVPAVSNLGDRADRSSKTEFCGDGICKILWACGGQNDRNTSKLECHHFSQCRGNELLT